MRANTRFPALVVAVALGISCLLTGCSGSGSAAGGGSTSGGGSSSGGGTGSSSGNTETLQSEFTYKETDAENGTITLEAKDSTITVTTNQTDGSKELNRTYYDENDKEAAAEIKAKAKANEAVQTTEKLTQDSDGNVSSVERTYVVSEDYIKAQAQTTTQSIAVEAAMAVVNGLFDLDEENEGNEGNEQNEVKLYKFVITYTYDATGTLTGATITFQPYSATPAEGTTTAITVSYKVSDGEWKSSTEVNNQDGDDTTAEVVKGVVGWIAEKANVEKAQLNEDGTSAAAEAEKTFKEVEKAKWTIIKDTSSDQTAYALISLPDKKALTKTIMQTSRGPSIYYEILTETSNAQSQTVTKDYWIEYKENLMEDGTPSSMAYTETTTTDEGKQKIRIDFSYSLYISGSAVTNTRLGSVIVKIGTSEQITAVNQAINNVYATYPAPVRASYASSEDYNAAYQETTQKRYEAFAAIPNCVMYIFKSAADQSGAQSTLIKAEYQQTLGTDEIKATVKAKLIEMYPGAEGTLTENSTDAEIAQAWEKYLRETAGPDVHKEVESELESALRLYQE